MEQLQQQDVGATFATARTRQTVVAAIATLFFLWFMVTEDFRYGEVWPAAVCVNLLELLILVTAVRAWHLVLRRPVELHLNPSELTVKRGDRQVAVPWGTVGEIRIDGDPRRPWVMARLNPTLSPDQVPAARRRDGSYRLFPIAHGRSVKKRNQQIVELRTAIMGYGRRWMDHDL